MLEIFSQIGNLVQEQNDCRGCCTPTIINCDTNKRESIFGMGLFDIMLPKEIYTTLVFIRGRTWSKNIFHKFNNSLPKLFLFLLPRSFNIFTMHQGSQQGRVGKRILLETPPINPSPSDYPTLLLQEECRVDM